MPHIRDDFNFVGALIGYGENLVHCAYCQKESNTLNGLKIVQVHIRNHILNGLIHMPEHWMESDDSDSDCDGKSITYSTTELKL